VESRSNRNFEVETPSRRLRQVNQFSRYDYQRTPLVECSVAKSEVAIYKSGPICDDVAGTNPWSCCRAWWDCPLTLGPHSPSLRPPSNTCLYIQVSAPPEAGTPSSQAQNGPQTLRWVRPPANRLSGQRYGTRREAVPTAATWVVDRIVAAVEDWVRYRPEAIR